jgi:hypothetical protein
VSCERELYSTIHNKIWVRAHSSDGSAGTHNLMFIKLCHDCYAILSDAVGPVDDKVLEQLFSDDIDEINYAIHMTNMCEVTRVYWKEAHTKEASMPMLGAQFFRTNPRPQ